MALGFASGKPGELCAGTYLMNMTDYSIYVLYKSKTIVGRLGGPDFLANRAAAGEGLLLMYSVNVFQAIARV